MRRRTRPTAGTLTVIGLILSGCAATEASKPKPLLHSGFGPGISGLRLAVQIDATGSTLRFQVRNVGTASVRIVERYSCSGYSHLWIQSGTHARRLSTSYVYETKRNGLTSKPATTTCTRNGPVSYRTVQPGATTAFTLRFARGETIARSLDKIVQGYALLSLDGLKGQGHVRLATPITRRR